MNAESPPEGALQHIARNIVGNQADTVADLDPFRIRLRDRLPAVWRFAALRCRCLEHRESVHE